MTAALYSIRSGKSVLVLEKENFGGQIANSPRVENFPSIKEISGVDFSDHLFTQITDLGAEFELEDVLEIRKDEHFYVKTNYHEYEAKSVIIATGVKHKKIGVQREDELVGKGVSYCAVCDGAFFASQDVALIGDANTALQYALLLSNTCNKVYLCMLFNKFFAEDILVKRVLERENIVVTKEIALKEFKGEDSLTGLVFENTKTHELVEFNVKGCFVCIGQEPDNKRFENLVELDDRGYFISNDTETKTPGLFVAGDCRVKRVRQLTTATSDGAIAAVNAVNYIDRL